MPRTRPRATMTAVRPRQGRRKKMPTVRLRIWPIRPRSWRPREKQKKPSPFMERQRLSGRRRIRLMRKPLPRLRQSMTRQFPRPSLLCPRQRRLWNPSFSLRPRHKIPILPLRKKTLLRQPMTRKLRKRAVTISSPSRWIWIRRRRNCPGWKRSSRPKARSLLLRREWSQG